MPSAEILTIGTELLLGEITDTNTQYLARQLRDAGIDLYYTSTVGDNEQRIADAVTLGLSRSDILLCTGGLGPTVDDVTREGIARALGVVLEFRPELWEQIEARFARMKRTPSENNKRQAELPVGGRSLENAVGSAPGVLVEHNGKVVIAVPGVPSEMRYLYEHGILPYFKERFGLTGVIRARVLHTAGVPESQIDQHLADLERQTNPTVGLAAHAGSVDVRLTAKAESAEQAAEMLDTLEAEVRQRLGDWVHGVDEETLARAVLREVAQRKQTIAVLEKGLNGAIVKAFTGEGNAFVGGEVLHATLRTEPLKLAATEYASKVRADLVLAVELRATKDGSHELEIFITGLKISHHVAFPYGGHTTQAAGWATSLALSFLRRKLLDEVN
ncbi:MAG: CinA family nicotinamide mononucleotide deamidase-related protein [Anaerolineales bacterium]|jgi:competence/damage-inducible protein CinA-like protein|nr:CinA family nicotinamide mononucleotide deamidase-related protein [Anaerolineales bacterium]